MKVDGDDFMDFGDGYFNLPDYIDRLVRRVRTDFVRTAPPPRGERWLIEARLELRVCQARDERVADVSGVVRAGGVNGTHKIRAYPTRLAYCGPNATTNQQPTRQKDAKSRGKGGQSLASSAFHSLFL